MTDRPRKWWLAVLLSLVATGLGQLYNGQWRKALLLCALPFPLLALAVYLFKVGSFTVWVVTFTLSAAAVVLVAVDAFIHARRQRHAYVLKPFNRVAVYFAAFVVLSLAGEAFKQSIRANVLRAFRTTSESMRPTFEPGDYFFVAMGPAARRPARSEVIVHRYPDDPTKEFVKRVVALEGDVVELRNKDLYVNGTQVPEPYVTHADPEVRPGGYDPRDNFGPTTVPPGSYFVLGDNRDNSNDSRFFGPIEEHLVQGKPLRIYWSWDMGTKSPRWDRVGKIVK